MRRRPRRRNEMPGWMTLLLVVWGCLLFAALLSGCAPLSEKERFEREYERAMVTEQYELCYAVVTSQGIWVTVNDPTAGTKLKRTRSTADMKRIMASNGCAPILRQLGYE